MENHYEVEITLEFDQGTKPTKDDVYKYLQIAMQRDSLRYDLDGELDSQLNKP